MPDFTQIEAGEKKEPKQKKDNVSDELVEMELQTEYLQKINSKLGFMQFVLIIYIILAIIGFIIR